MLDTIEKEAQVTALLKTISQLNSILMRQIELIAFENSEGGDLVSNTLGEILDGDSSDGASICSRLMPAFERMQTVDIIQQQLVGVRKALGMLNRTLEECLKADAEGEEWPDVRGLLDEVYATYVMKQQRDVHDQALGREVSLAEDTSDIEFF